MQYEGLLYQHRLKLLPLFNVCRILMYHNLTKHPVSEQAARCQVSFFTMNTPLHLLLYFFMLLFVILELLSERNNIPKF